LVRLFPDEKTVHLPADGHPLAGYELAKADVLSRGGSVSGYASADSDEGAVISSGRKSLWAALFGGDDEEADARPTRGRGNSPKPQPTVMAYATPARDDSNSNDGGRFAVAVQAPAPDPVARTVVRERSERLAPRIVAPQEPQVAALAPAAAPPPVDDKRPRLIDAPIPLARPRGLTMPLQPGDSIQVAALPASGGALAFAPQGAAAEDQKFVLASLPPRRPDQMVSLIEAVVEGKPMNAPLPPTRPAAFANLVLADLRGGANAAAETPQAQPVGRLVTITHPLPPGRPREDGFALASVPAVSRHAPSPAPTTPIVAQYDADRTGLDSLFATVVRSPATAGKAVTVATARTKAGPANNAEPIQAPGPAASLGFSHAEPSDAKTGSFSGPAVRPLPTNFVQN
jgi:hypothetical protein